jgi:hypothetical protein
MPSLPCRDATLAVRSLRIQRHCSACRALTPPLAWDHSLPSACADAQPAALRLHLCRGVTVCPVPAPLLSLPYRDATFAVESRSAQCLRHCSGLACRDTTLAVASRRRRLSPLASTPPEFVLSSTSFRDGSRLKTLRFLSPQSFGISSCPRWGPPSRYPRESRLVMRLIKALYHGPAFSWLHR